MLTNRSRLIQDFVSLAHYTLTATQVPVPFGIVGPLVFPRKPVTGQAYGESNLLPL